MVMLALMIIWAAGLLPAARELYRWAKQGDEYHTTERAAYQIFVGVVCSQVLGFFVGLASEIALSWGN